MKKIIVIAGAGNLGGKIVKYYWYRCWSASNRPVRNRP
jgi:hypothetical protein